MSRFRVVPWFPFVAILLTGCSSSSSGPILNGTPSGPPSSTDVATYHYDNQRTGENLKETALDTSNVNSAMFGKVGEFAVDGQIDGQTLFLSQRSEERRVGKECRARWSWTHEQRIR